MTLQNVVSAAVLGYETWHKKKHFATLALRALFLLEPHLYLKRNSTMRCHLNWYTVYCIPDCMYSRVDMKVNFLFRKIRNLCYKNFAEFRKILHINVAKFSRQSFGEAYRYTICNILHIFQGPLANNESFPI
jgi:hypothetical protein